MKLLIPIAVLAIVVACVCADQIDRDRKWQRFKLRHNKKYADRKDEERSYERYKKNVRAMEMQKGKISYKLKETPYSDIDPEEDKISGRGLKFNNQTLDRMKRGASETYVPKSGLYLPSSFSFMQNSGCKLVTKFQGSCGSCWAFSSTSAIEGQVCKKTGKLVELSPQFLVDCKPESGGCNGDWPKAVFEYVTDYGVNLEKDYPYKAQKQNCRTVNSHKKFRISKSVSIPYKQDDDAENIRLHKSALVEHGPLVITMYASDRNFMNYGGGVYDDKGYYCREYADHAVVLVGYGRENGVDYWLIKNSWGTDWGDEGYGKVKMGTCNMYTHSVIPVIDNNLASVLKFKIQSQDIEEGDPIPQ